MKALKVVGRRLLCDDGSDPRLLGTICGSFGDEPGWPLVSTQALDAIAHADLNWTHVRTGPFTAEGEAPEFAFYLKAANGKYDLTRINPDFIGLLRTRISEALARGIYVEVDLPVDRWVRQHGAGNLPFVDPWSARNNSQGEEHGGLGIFSLPPDLVHRAAIANIVTVLRDFPNVIYQAGNEAFKADSATFTRAVVALVKSLHPAAVVGSNSSVLADYVALHQNEPPSPMTLPVTVNEYAEPNPLPSQVVNNALTANRNGTYYHYWKGDHTQSQWLATCKTLGDIRMGRPVETPPAPICARPDFESTGWSVTCRRKGDQGKPLCPPSHQQVFANVLSIAYSRVVPPPPNAGQDRIVQFLEEIAADMQRQGICAWHDHDAVMARKEPGVWFELHPWNFSGGTVVTPTLAFIAAWKLEGDQMPPVETNELQPIVQGKSVTIQIPIQPTIAGHIDEHNYNFKLPAGLTITGVRSFLGVDQGNAGEYAFDLLSNQGRLYSRSMHKEAPLGIYEAWERVVLPGKWDASVNFTLHTLAHQTTPAAGNVQFELILELL